jgi:hypothetical protein
MSRRCIVLSLLVGFLALAAEARAQGHFLRSDADRNQTVELTDGVFTLNYLFLGGPAPKCLDAADVDDNGQVNLGDAVRIFNFLFLGGPPPAAPFPVYEADPTDDDSVSCLVSDASPIVDKTGNITANETWTNDKVYRLISGVVVKPGATLTIEAGTTVLGDSTSDGLLLVERGARIVAIGTERYPVVFTSDKPVGTRARGDWGGIIICGRADNNLPEKVGEVEGVEGQLFGGGREFNAQDDSGILRFVRVEFGGTEISVDNEINAITLAAVGSGTQLDHIQCRYNLDDGIEWFGGSVDLKFALCLGIRDDSFDYALGWRGNGQFWVAQQRGDDADRGFEVDNSETEFTALPLTRPTISNLTLIGDPDTVEGVESTEGLELRRGCGTVVYNGIVSGFKVAGMDIDDGVTTNHNPTNGELIVANTVFHNNGAGGTVHFRAGETGANEEVAANGFQFTTVDFGRTLNTGNVELGPADPSPIVNPYDLLNSDFRPQNAALDNVFNPISLGSFFESVSYRGGVPPTGPDWTKRPWISYSQN